MYIDIAELRSSLWGYSTYAYSVWAVYAYAWARLHRKKDFLRKKYMWWRRRREEKVLVVLESVGLELWGFSWYCRWRKNKPQRRKRWSMLKYNEALPLFTNKRTSAKPHRVMWLFVQYSWQAWEWAGYLKNRKSAFGQFGLNGPWQSIRLLMSWL